MNNSKITPGSPQPPTRTVVSPFFGIFFCFLSAFTGEIALAGWYTDDPVGSLARLSILFLSLYTVHRFATVTLNRYRPASKDFVFLHLVIIISIVIIQVGRILSEAVSQYFIHSGVANPVSAASLEYAIPFATGGLLIQAVLGMQYGLVFSISLALLVGFYSASFTIFFPFILITTLAACLSLTSFRTRSAYLRAGFNIALIALPFALASFVILGEPVTASEMTARIIGVLAGGVLCSFLAAGVTPVVEHLGGYVTDMRLLEMATLDHPLLKELSIQAPGTWNHSMVIGMMVEAAADAIDANPVLARVGAYFHDIGKMKKPLYFVENQSGGENRHDKLSTSMSALIIRSHVKDGVELAKQYKLPEPIVNMIPEHHGTSLIEYFFDKAKKEAKEAEEDIEVDRSLYSYPGPRPQTREAGLLMLADGIEAAARTLSEPSQDRIQGLVQKMINKVFASGELNECELTLKDLHVIARCFTRVLTGIYHQRVAYHEPAEKGTPATPAPKDGKDTKAKAASTKGKKKDENDAVVASGDTPEEKSEQPKSKSDKKESTEDLKRLGL